MRWVVPGMVPEGVALLAGKPKLGKSWLAMGLCVAVASGGVAFGNVRVEKGSALYLALEDNERRLQFRLKKILARTEVPDGLHYSVECPRLDEGGVEAVEGWLRSRPDARLVVIDTLAKIRPRQRRGANAYQEDYEALEALLPLAARHNVAVLVVHHLRKMAASDPLDEVNSSIGLTGGVEKEVTQDVLFAPIVLEEHVGKLYRAFIGSGAIGFLRHAEIATKLIQAQDHAANRIEPLREGHSWLPQVHAPEGHLEEGPGYGAAIVRCHSEVAIQLHVESALIAVEPKRLLATSWSNFDFPRCEHPEPSVA